MSSYHNLILFSFLKIGAGVSYTIALLHQMLREDINYTLQVYANFEFEFQRLEEHVAFTAVAKVVFRFMCIVSVRDQHQRPFETTPSLRYT